MNFLGFFNASGCILPGVRRTLGTENRNESMRTKEKKGDGSLRFMAMPSCGLDSYMVSGSSTPNLHWPARGETFSLHSAALLGQDRTLQVGIIMKPSRDDAMGAWVVGSDTERTGKASSLAGAPREKQK